MSEETKTYTQEELDQILADRIAEANKGLEKNRDAALAEAKAAKERLKALEGIDPEEYRTLKEQQEKAERERQEAAGNFKALEQQLVEKHQKELDGVRSKLEDENKRLRASLEANLIDAEATRILAEHSDSPSLLLPHVRSQMKVVEEDGKFFARIVDEAGNVRIGTGKGSDPMTTAELIEEMKQDKAYALAFRGTGSSGGGASRSTASGGGRQQVVTSGDNDAFVTNLEGIAKGDVEVR